MREISDLDILNTFTLDFCEIVQRHVEYIIVSGFVAIVSGRTRGTEDIDIIIRKLSFENYKKLHEDLLLNGFSCLNTSNIDEIFEILNEKSSVRYTYKNKTLPEMEVKFEKDILDDYQFKTKTKLELSDIDIFYSSIEMNIAFKEEYLQSEKDFEDANHLRLVYQDEVNENEISNCKELIKKCRMN